MNVKLGVVGLIRGRQVAGEIIGEEGVTLRAICDRNPETLESAGDYFINERKLENLLCFDSFDDIINSDIDAIYIATDADCHVPYVIRALEAGKHVISEIPAVASYEEAVQLKEAVKRHPKLKYMAAENCFYWAFIEAWKSMYEQGKFGKAVYAESEYLHAVDFHNIKEENYPADHWRTHFPAIKYLTHNLGPLLYIMDDKCVSAVCIEPDIKYNPYKKGAENGVALFKTAKGAVIRILISFGAYVGFDHNFRIIGTKGTVETDNTKPLGASHSFARFSDIPGSLAEKTEIPVALSFPGETLGEHGGADKKMMMDFIRCIREDTPSPIDVDMGIKISLPGIYAKKSAESGGIAVEIPDIE